MVPNHLQPNEQHSWTSPYLNYTVTDVSPLSVSLRVSVSERSTVWCVASPEDVPIDFESAQLTQKGYNIDSHASATIVLSSLKPSSSYLLSCFGVSVKRIRCCRTLRALICINCICLFCCVCVCIANNCAFSMLRLSYTVSKNILFHSTPLRHPIPFPLFSTPPSRSFQNSPSFLLLLSHYFFIIQFLSNEHVFL